MPFVVGVARSGTTLLRLMLDAHPDLAIPHETHFIPAVLREPQAGREDFFRKLTEFPTWEDLKTPAERFRQELLRLEPFDVRDGLRAFYRLYAGLRGKSRWGDKSPPAGVPSSPGRASPPMKRSPEISSKSLAIRAVVGPGARLAGGSGSSRNSRQRDASNGPAQSCV